MYDPKILQRLTEEVEQLKTKGAYKKENIIESPQGAKVKVGEQEMIMLASNNYLGLASHPEVIAEAKNYLDKFGNGLASVRFICGTTPPHLELEKKLSQLLSTEDSLLFSSCFAANEAFFATIINQLNLKAVVYSDELNHASIIDALKLVKKELMDKKIYQHNNLDDLKKLLIEDKAKDYELKIIATDGVFSMEGEVAKLAEIVALAKEFQCLTFVDDAHGIGAIGQTGAGSSEVCGTLGKIDVISGTLGKSLGGAGGGFLSGRRELIEFFRQKARPYTFSNNVSPAALGASLKALAIIKSTDLLEKLKANTEFFRAEIKKRNLQIIEGDHPIVPIMVGETKLTQEFAAKLRDKGLYIVGLWFPVVPEGTARLRVQISAAHSETELLEAVEIIAATAKELKIIN